MATCRLKTNLPPNPDLLTLMREAQEKFDALSPEEQAEIRAEQRRSFARGLMD